MKKRLLILITIVAIAPFFRAPIAYGAADNQSFAGFGTGFQMGFKDNSGLGFYFKGEAGYAFNKIWGAGLHVGYSRLGKFELKALDFGAFAQAMSEETGVYARFYLDGVRASTTGTTPSHGISDTATALAFGAGLGMMLPVEGDTHFAPELTYKPAFFSGTTIHFFTATVSLIWDL